MDSVFRKLQVNNVRGICLSLHLGMSFNKKDCIVWNYLKTP